MSILSELWSVLTTADHCRHIPVTVKLLWNLVIFQIHLAIPTDPLIFIITKVLHVAADLHYKREGDMEKFFLSLLCKYLGWMV